MYIKIAVNAYSAQPVSDTDATGNGSGDAPLVRQLRQPRSTVRTPGPFGYLKKIIGVVLIGSELGGMMRVAPLWWKRGAEPC